MSLISASIEVDVPISFANREGSEFVWRTFVGHYTMPIDQFTRSVGGDESEADNGVVRFETKGNRLTKVSVELTYSPRSADTAEQEEAQVRARLRHDLEQYHSFLLQRCDATQCRTVWQEAPANTV